MRRKDKPISLMPSEQLLRRDRDPYEKQRADLIAQIDALQALLKAERLKSAKLAFQLEELRNSSQAA
jgi:hypothetical protein